MKQIRITLTELQWEQLQKLIGKVETKRGNPIINILMPNAQESTLEDPTPIGGGGGGGAPKPKPTT